jgi:hypothetical protein
LFNDRVSRFYCSIQQVVSGSWQNLLSLNKLVKIYLKECLKTRKMVIIFSK